MDMLVLLPKEKSSIGYNDCQLYIQSSNGPILNLVSFPQSISEHSVRLIFHAIVDIAGDPSILQGNKNFRITRR